jgi:hypothetical protein
MFILHNTIADLVPAVMGTYYAHGMLFADDGFGNYIETNISQVVDFFISAA